MADILLMCMLIIALVFASEKAQDNAVHRHGDCILTAAEINPTVEVRTAVLTCRAAYEKER